MPDSLADFSLPPTASMCQPMWVRLSSTAASMASTANTYTPAGMFSQLVPSAFRPTLPRPS